MQQENNELENSNWYMLKTNAIVINVIEITPKL